LVPGGRIAIASAVSAGEVRTIVTTTAIIAHRIDLRIGTSSAGEIWLMLSSPEKASRHERRTTCAWRAGKTVLKYSNPLTEEIADVRK
jgi:hypothetical protein